MINDKLVRLEAWLKKRDQRERVFLALIVVTLTYAIWNLFIDRGLVSEQTTLKNAIDATQAEINTTHLQVQNIMDIINNSAFEQKLQQQKNLSSESVDFKQRLENLIPTAIATKDLPALTAAILQTPGVTLISLKKLPSESWIPKGLTVISLSESAKNISKYSLELTFTSDYFSTIEYLHRLEKLSWHLYWDNLQYKVTQYPKAVVVVRMYVLSN